MAHDIFISYSSKDKPIADAICAHLEAAGIRCWIAPRDIIPGEDRPTAITRAISQGRVLVLVFSASSNASEDVSRELYLAVNHKLVIIPFKIENVEPEPGKQYYLARTHWLDALNPPTQEQIQNLVERVKTLVPLKGPATSEDQTQRGRSLETAIPFGGGLQPPKQASIKRRISPWLWLVLIGIVLISLLGWTAFNLVWKRPAGTSQPTQSSTSTVVTTLPTNTQTILPGANVTAPAGFIAKVFTKVYISEPFNDNSLDWPVGNSTGQNWLGTLAIANGVLDWEGDSVTRMNALIHPWMASLQDDLTDQEVSTWINLVSQDAKGAYGLYLRGAGDGSRFYAFYVLADQFAFMSLNGENHWKNLFGWEYSPAFNGEGWIKMSVQATGSHFRLFVNDQLLTELDDTSLSSGQSGLLVTAYMEGKTIQVQFDDFQVLLPSP